MAGQAGPVHLVLVEKIPVWRDATRKRSTREIQELLLEQGYDVEFVSEINDDFGRGFGAARDVIIEMLSRMYWEGQKQARGEDGI